MSEQADALLGREIDQGRYAIRSTIGHGGMGSVYLAHQRSVDRLVAIKFIHPRLLIDENLKLRFHREATVMASITSPNCATVFDYGETEDGLLYIVMEHLQGKSLADVLKETGPLPLDTFSDWFSQVCAGVQAAHRKGLVHRDLKPENLFVESGPDGTYIKVLDFGLAKILRGDDLGDTQGLTTPGLVFGTPQYMSPEQAKGDAVDVRTDIYALGLIAFECLTGRPAFAGRTPEALLIAQATAPPPDVSAIRDDAPESMRRAIRRSLAKTPEKRHDSVELFLADMENVHPTEPEAETLSDTATMSPVEAFAMKLDIPAESDDSLSPVALGTAPPAAPKTTNLWKISTLLLLGLCCIIWWRSEDMQAPTNAAQPQPVTVETSETTNTVDAGAQTVVPASCESTPIPAYDTAGRPCIDSETATYWSFDGDFIGRGLERPPQVLKPKGEDALKFDEDGVFEQAVRFNGTAESRLNAQRPYALGDGFTIEGWVRPYGEPDLGCGQVILGTGEPYGFNQCHQPRLRQGWVVLMTRVDEGLYDLSFVTRNQDLSEKQTTPIMVTLRGPTPLLVDRWNHFAVVSDGSSVAVMVNGRIKAYQRKIRIYEQHGYYSIGGYRNHSNGLLSASIDSLRLSDSHRPTAGIKDAYDRAKRLSTSQGKPPSSW